MLLSEIANQAAVFVRLAGVCRNVLLPLGAGVSVFLPQLGFRSPAQWACLGDLLARAW